MSGRVPRIVVYKRRDGLWEWQAKSLNGAIVATSAEQGYSSRSKAWAGVRSTLRVFLHAEIPS